MIEYEKLGKSELVVSKVSLGTWAFGSDEWWGLQDDKLSVETIWRAIDLGINLIDTAPVYGRGHSEIIVGKALKEKNLRDKVILATKVGLRWRGKLIYSNLRRESILEEFQESLERLDTDYIDLYQVHWPDPHTPISETASCLYELYQKKKIRTIGVSNYSVKEMVEFLKYSPLHSLQPLYNMFRREIEKDILPFCIENNISVIVYSPLNNGILTGKFFFGEKIPKDEARKCNVDLRGRNFQINKRVILELDRITSKYSKKLSQLVLNWVIRREGVTSAIVGARNTKQIEENSGCMGWEILKEDLIKIEEILERRERLIGLNPPLSKRIKHLLFYYLSKFLK